MNRKPIWRVRGGRYLPGPLVFAIINLTPDSFYDGGRHADIPSVLQYCRACAAAGVDVLDLGAESTRPGALPVPPEEEWLRLEPTLTALARLNPGPRPAAEVPAAESAGAASGKRGVETGAADATTYRTESAGTGGGSPASATGMTAVELNVGPAEQADAAGQANASGVPAVGMAGADAADKPAPALSVDTYHAATARQALLAGADVINDISAFNFDPALKEVLLEHRPGYVLMHSPAPPRTMQAAPVYTDVVSEVKRFLETKMNELVSGGFPEERIILDPGIGFGKTLDHNLELLRRLDCLAELGRPLLIGLSNKTLFGDLLGLGVTERARATQTAVAVLALQNVYAHRVHEALETMQTLKLVEALSPERAVAPAASRRASAGESTCNF